MIIYYNMSGTNASRIPECSKDKEAYPCLFQYCNDDIDENKYNSDPKADHTLKRKQLVLVWCSADRNLDMRKNIRIVIGRMKDLIKQGCDRGSMVYGYWSSSSKRYLCSEKYSNTMIYSFIRSTQVAPLKVNADGTKICECAPRCDNREYENEVERKKGIEKCKGVKNPYHIEERWIDLNAKEDQQMDEENMLVEAMKKDIKELKLEYEEINKKRRLEGKEAIDIEKVLREVYIKKMEKISGEK